MIKIFLTIGLVFLNSASFAAGEEKKMNMTGQPTIQYVVFHNLDLSGKQVLIFVNSRA